MQTTSGRQCEGAETYLGFLQLFVGHEEAHQDALIGAELWRVRVGYACSSGACRAWTRI